MTYYSTRQVNDQGFTLLELTLYIAILATLIIGVTAFANQTLSSRVKNTSIMEVEQQGNNAIRSIVRSINNSSGINSPLISSAASSLSLAKSDTPLENPTIYDVSSNVLTIAKGANPAVPITNSRVKVIAFTVKNLSQTGTSGIIRVTLTLSYNNISGTNEYDYTKTFYGSGAIRQ